jgi:outer membrane protein assembly factor BamB
MRLAPGALVSAALLAACAGNYRLDRGQEGYGAPRAVLQLRWQKRLVHHDILSYRPQEWAAATFGPRRRSAGQVKRGTPGQAIVLVGSSARSFAAFGARGEQLWRFETGGTVSSVPWYNPRNKIVYFGCDDGKLYAIDALTGKVRWTYKTKGTIVHPPAYHDGVLLFTSSENRIYGLDADTGRWRWQYDRAAPEGFTIQGYAGVLVVGAKAYTGFADGVLVALKPSTGEVIWTKSLAGGRRRFVDIDTTPVLADGKILTASYASGLYALSPDTGSVAWSYPQVGIAAITASSYGPFIVAPRAGLVALNNKGQQRWRQAYPKGVPAEPLIAGPYVIIGGTESGLAVAEARTGRLLQYFDPGYGISARASLEGETVAVLSNRGRLYVFDLAL